MEKKSKSKKEDTDIIWKWDFNLLNPGLLDYQTFTVLDKFTFNPAKITKKTPIGMFSKSAERRRASLATTTLTALPPAPVAPKARLDEAEEMIWEK